MEEVGAGAEAGAPSGASRGEDGGVGEGGADARAGRQSANSPSSGLGRSRKSDKSHCEIWLELVSYRLTKNDLYLMEKRKQD